MGFEKIKRPLFQPSEKVELVTVSTAGTTLKNIGFYELYSTSTAGPIEVEVQTPEIGNRVHIVCRAVGSTSSVFYVDATSSGYTFDGTNDRIMLGSNDAINMVGQSSSRYLIEATYAPTTLTLSTST